MEGIRSGKEIKPRARELIILRCINNPFALRSGVHDFWRRSTVIDLNPAISRTFSVLTVNAPREICISRGSIQHHALIARDVLESEVQRQGASGTDGLGAAESELHWRFGSVLCIHRQPRQHAHEHCTNTDHARSIVWALDWSATKISRRLSPPAVQFWQERACSRRCGADECSGRAPGPSDWNAAWNPACPDTALLQR